MAEVPTKLVGGLPRHRGHRAAPPAPSTPPCHSVLAPFDLGKGHAWHLPSAGKHRASPQQQPTSTRKKRERERERERRAVERNCERKCLQVRRPRRVKPAHKCAYQRQTFREKLNIFDNIFRHALVQCNACLYPFKHNCPKVWNLGCDNPDPSSYQSRPLLITIRRIQTNTIANLKGDSFLPYTLCPHFHASHI